MKKQTFQLFASCLILLSLIAGCDSDILTTSNPDKAVVNAVLFPGKPAQVSINHQYVYERGDTTFHQPLLNLTVTLTNQTDNQSETMQMADSGIYVSSMLIQAEKSYRIDFDYAGNHIWAETEIPSAVEGFSADAAELTHTERFSSDTVRYVNYRWDNSEDVYHLFTIEHISLTYPSIYGFEPDSHFITRNPTRDTTLQVNSRGFNYYGTHLMMLTKVNQEYVNLYYSTVSNSQYMSEPPTNIHNGFGIFTGMNPDTLRLELK